jgi:hypothetical protein
MMKATDDTSSWLEADWYGATTDYDRRQRAELRLLDWILRPILRSSEMDP